MKKEQFNFKKKFGQNFIQDNNIIKNIIAKSNIGDDTLVIEVGPGSGALTKELIKNSKNVLCYEIDISLKPILDEIVATNPNVKIIYGDFLKSNVLEDIKEYDYKKIYLIANLPYYITTPIIMKVIELNIIDKLVIMVQKEVGERFRAKTRTKDYNSLTVYLNYYFEINKLLDVSRNAFIPVPNVDSVVVEMIKKDKPLVLKNKELFFKLVRDSFNQKRKTLKNNLINYDLDKISNVLSMYNYDLSTRAEALPLEVFVDIANNISD